MLHAMVLKSFVFLAVCCTTGFCQLGFLSQPQDVIAAPDLPLLIMCTANTTLTGTLHILWKRNDTWITDYNSKHYRQLSNGSLFFERFLYADQGSYQCSALVISSHNVHVGQIYSRTASIKMAYIQNAFTLHPESRSGLIGSNIQLQCMSPKSEPIAKIYWEKDNKRLYGLPNATLTLTSERILSATVMIRNLSTSDTGTYRCVAYNVLLKNVNVNSNTATISIAAVQERPYFEKKPSSAIVSRFRPFTWECLIRGVPQPTIQWFHNNQLISNDSSRFMLTTGALHFISMEERYNGSYACEGSNTLGRIRLSPPVALIVAFIDFDFVTDPTSKNVTFGETLVLRCSPPRRYPQAVTISWYEDYRLLTPSGSVSIASDGTLRITGITRAFEGSYFCQAYHTGTRVARSSKKADVVVRVLPSIQTALSNVSGLVGQSLTRVCTALGYPTPYIRWFRNGQILSNDANLVLSNISLKDAGFYSCVAVNIAGNNSKSFYLHVSTFPAVLVAPSNQTKITGQSAEFKCEFFGTPKPVPFWYFVGTGSSLRRPLVFGSRITKTSDGFRVSPIIKSDEGKYICQGNSSGGSLKVFAFLRVLVPPSFLATPKNKTTVVSSDVTFQCSATGDPVPNISWFFNGNPVRGGSKYEISLSSIKIKRVIESDAGSYICRISNIAGRNVSHAFLDVQVAPSITGFAVPEKVPIGSNFSLHCNGTGNPQPVIRWRRNSTTFLQIDRSRVMGDMNNMKIINARPTDSGSYECILSNALGSVQRLGMLFVQVLPNPPKDLKAVSLLSTSVTVSWTQGFDGYSSTLGYHLEFAIKDSGIWTVYDGNLSAKLPNITLAGLEPYTLYSFRMKSFTVIGPSVYSLSVEVRTLEGAPLVPVNLRVEPINATTVMVRWSRPSQTNGNITTYQLHYSVINNPSVKIMSIEASEISGYQVLVQPLQPFSAYYLKMRAATGSSSNRKWGNFSATVNFKTPEAVPSAAPFLQSVIANTSTSIWVSFSSLPNSMVNGILIAYEITTQTVDEERKIRTNNTRIIITSLRKYTRYSVHVKACNRVGCGPKSETKFVTTLEDVPGLVRNVTAAANTSTSFIVKWLEPLEQFGVITGYVISIKNGLTNDVENVSLSGNESQYLKEGQSNTTYYITIAAKTRIGLGPNVPWITVTFEEIRPRTTPKVLTSSSSKPTITQTFTSTSTTTTPTGVVGGNAKKSVDWLDEKNLPILIGVSVAVFILLIAVIVLGAFVCSRRFVAGTEKREHWLSTRTHSGTENPVFIDRGLELRKTPVTESQTSDKAVSINTANSKAIDDDFLFELESESQIGDNNPSNEYAYDDTMRVKEKDDKSPLMKLRNNEIDLGDDASIYDPPYSDIGELGGPIKDLFSFIDDEEGKSFEPSSFDDTKHHDSFSSNNDSRKSSSGYQDDVYKTDDSKAHDAQTTANPDLTWDDYDTSRAPAVHDPDEVVYDTPVHEVEEHDGNIPEYATVQKKTRDKRETDKFLLLNNEEPPASDTLEI